MTSFNSGAQPQNRAPQSIGFLLLDNFTLISLASAVEPYVFKQCFPLGRRFCSHGQLHSFL